MKSMWDWNEVAIFDILWLGVGIVLGSVGHQLFSTV